MVIKNLTKLDKKNIEKVKSLGRVQSLSIPTPLFYQGHVPLVAYLVIDGVVNLTKNKKVKSTVRAGGIIGVKELMQHTPSTVTAEAAANTTLCYLDRSTVQDILRNKESELATFFQDLTESDDP